MLLVNSPQSISPLAPRQVGASSERGTIIPHLGATIYAEIRYSLSFHFRLILIFFLGMVSYERSLAFPLTTHYQSPMTTDIMTNGLLTDNLLHDFHTSIAEVAYNEVSKSFEVSLRVFTDDFEAALAGLNNQKDLRLDKSNKHHPLIGEYLRKNFFLFNAKNQKYDFVFVGKEMEGDVTWVYFEIPVKSLKSLFIQNSVLTEIFEDQTNLVNISIRKQKKTYIFKRSEISHPLALS